MRVESTAVEANVSMTPGGVRRSPSAGPPGGRATRARVATVAAVALIAVVAMYGLYASLSDRGYRFDFGFLAQPAGVEISEGVTPAWTDGITLEAFRSTDANAQALTTGLFNTLKVSVVGIVVSTLLGLGIAVGRSSTNWLLRQSCFLYVETVRNTPLLIQLVAWYFAVILKLPLITSAAKVYGVLIVSRQGMVLPALTLPAGPAAAEVALTAAVFIACSLAVLPVFTRATRLGLVAAALFGCVALWWTGHLVVEFPAVDRFDATAGAKLSPEMAALLLALTVNTAAFIAEAIRGAIESLPKGQWEAASALGMQRRAIRRDIVIPQVFRIVLPSLGNQYISLAKSTSFGIAIGYPDLFNIYGTVANQTGRTLESMALVIGAYLLLSWSISLCVNLLNRHLSRRGGAQ